MCGWISGTSPRERPNAISHLCSLVRVRVFPVQSVQHVSTLVVLNVGFRLYVLVSHLVTYTVYKHPYLAPCLIWVPETAGPHQRKGRKSELEKAT